MLHIRASLPFSPVPKTQQALESYLSLPRIGKYIAAARGDRSLAFRLYRWNAQLCEALYLPSQMIEVGFRNRIAEAMNRRFTPSWPILFNSKHLQALPKGARDKIAEAAGKIGNKTVTADRVISNLQFGFWCRMLDKRYDTVLWSAGISASFPGLPASYNRAKLQRRMDEIRDFRNRIAHHESIFDKDPRKHLDFMITAIGWICGDAQALTMEMSADFETVYAARPR